MTYTNKTIQRLTSQALAIDHTIVIVDTTIMIAPTASNFFLSTDYLPNLHVRLRGPFD